MTSAPVETVAAIVVAVPAATVVVAAAVGAAVVADAADPRHGAPASR